ncbi:tetratricopeptide repeat protein [Chelatococcus albus]|uniref:tetratricopeptide repeat protein n=1 Tax=Chelatococcus albus TaxID=3047466 RepID=UPI003BEEFF9D
MFKRSARLVLLATSLSTAALLATGPAAAARGTQAMENRAEPFEPAESIEGNYLAAVVAGAQRDTNAAAAYFREALRADPRNAELMERAFVAFLADGEMQEAFRAAERLAARDRDNGLAQLALGVRDLKARRYDTARKHLMRGGRGRAADITATLLSAWSYAGSGQHKRGLDTVERLKGESTYNIFRDYHAGLIAAVGGDRAEAERRLKAAYDAERTTLRVVDAYGRFAASQGRREAALDAYESFDKLLPRHPLVRDAIALLKAGKPLAPLVGNPQQGAAEVLYGLGAAGNSQGDELAAMIYLRLALHLDPKHVLAMITLGDILERLKQYESAIAVYDAVPADSPVRANADVQIGLAYEALGKSDEALKHLEGLVKAEPDNVEALTALGNLQRTRKNFAESAETYSKAIARIGTPDRSHWTMFYFRGIAYERAKQWPKAEADFKKALELAPESIGRDRALVLNYLGYSWVDQGINLDEAFQMLKRAVELRPRDGYIVDSLGWAYYRLGRYDDAVRELERAIELKPSDPTINDHLGDAYWKVGRRLEAKFQWTHAKDLGPEPEDLVKIEKKLVEGLVEADKPAAAEADPDKAGKDKNGG